MRRLVLFASLILLSQGVRGASAAPPGFAFLEVPTGARAASLGGAYASLATGTEAVYWNPASLADNRGMEIAFGHSELFEQLRHDYFAVGGHMFGGGIAASVRALYSGPIEERDELGNLIGSFGSHDLELALGYGRDAGAGISVGGSAAVVRERIANLAATTYAFSGGAAWAPSAIAGLRAAFVAQNLGLAARYTIDGVRGEPVGLPAAVQTGVSYSRDVSSRLRATGAIEARGTRGRSVLGFLGAEVADATGASLRLGVRANDTASTLSFGAGYALPRLTFDYAFVPLRDDLGDTQRFAIRARF